jgi:hypothetical protein
MNHFIFSDGEVTLNDEQARIVRQPPQQNLRILASAGSGKTTTLTTRIAHLLTHETPTSKPAKPSEIILLTFTHNAAAVMSQRLTGLISSKRILCGTFHSLSQQILKEQSPEALQDLYHVDELPLKALDFLGSPKGQTWIRTLKWLFIDEFQDINDTQYAFIKALHHEGATITIVGDDAQNIYSWRGSCVDYILNFHKKFPEVADFQLATNYRSTAAIVAVANSIMRFIPTLDHKELMSAAPQANQGTRPAVHYFARTSEERDWVCDSAFHAVTSGTVGGSTVILSKFNSVLYAYEAALLKLGIRVRFVQGEESQEQHVNTNSRGPTIFLSTFHGSKGLEWDNVFLVRMNDEVFPQQKDEDGVLQERRLFYVAVTRARKTLTLTYSRHSKSLSRFVREIHRPLLEFRGLPNYELSTLTSQIEPTKVSDWISVLSGEDFRMIKQLGVLPASLRLPREPETSTTATATATTIRDQWVLPYWWVEQGLATEFFDFLRAFWHREIGVARPESGGQWDRDSQRVIWTVKIAAEDATFFETHRTLFEDLATRFFGATEPGTAPPQIYYTEVIAAIPQLILQALDQKDLIRVIQIIHKMRTVLYNLRFAFVKLSDLRFAAIRHSPPQESRCELIEAWRTYTERRPLESTPETADLNAIYKIGLCRALAEGRSGVLTNQPGEREWSRCRPFLTAFRARAASIIEENKTQPILCRVQVEVTAGVTCDVDMIVGRIAWFFVSGDQTSELQRLDRLITILLTVHGLRLNGFAIDHVCLFQLITGATFSLSVRDWLPSTSSLLTSFIQARASHGS